MLDKEIRVKLDKAKTREKKAQIKHEEEGEKK